MFSDLEIAKQFSCGRTKTTAIVKQAVAPHFLDQVMKDLTNPFSILMDESNDKNDKSCIILVRMFDSSVGDICHLADLTVKAGLKALPVDIDQLFIDVFYYFYHSSKRNQEFCNLWCSLFTTEPEVILKHCPTRWLSLLHCVGRYLSQYDGLKSYFLSCDEQSAKVRSISERLGNPLTRPLLLFLSYILPPIDRFNSVS